ncbi:MAG: hypothetical protein WCD79_14805 [Chthoniobacteraceae bacterium]
MKHYLALLFSALFFVMGMLPATANADYDRNHPRAYWVHRHFAMVHHHRIWVPGHPEIR